MEKKFKLIAVFEDVAYYYDYCFNSLCKIDYFLCARHLRLIYYFCLIVFGLCVSIPFGLQKSVDNDNFRLTLNNC